MTHQAKLARGSAQHSPRPSALNVDLAEDNFSRLKGDVETRLASVLTEQDARFQLVNRIIVEVLGWNWEEVQTEPHTEAGYIDYLLRHGGTNLLVIEAKRTGQSLIASVVERRSSFKLGGPALLPARDGIQQAIQYCLETGVPFAALTNGITWLGFRALRTDGRGPFEGQAITFPGLQSIADNLSEFYDLFSREGVIERRYTVHLNRAEGMTITHGENLVAVVPESEIRLLSKSPLAHDLDRIFSAFFSNLSGENDAEMLARCFVETTESHEADRSLEKITRDIINYVETIHIDAGDELEKEIAASVEAQRGQTVLIIGNKGAGKSTFIDRFFGLVLDKNLRKKCLVLRLDLADSPGDVTAIQSWLTERLKDEIEKALYDGGTPDYDELQGVFFKEYQRWTMGEFKHLYDSNKTEFKIRFGEFLYRKVEEAPYKYVINLLRHAIRSRRLTPCLVFDNTDHFPQPFQEAVFQYAQSIYRAVLSVVLVPITDRTIWQLSKAGPFQSYVTKTFYLPVPSTKRVLEKRVEFIKEKLTVEGVQKEEYFTSRGIRVSVENIYAFAACIEEIFLRTELISRRVGWLGNHDIRRSLQISQRIMTSPTLCVDELIKTFLVGHALSIPRYKITMALLLADHNRYHRKANDFVMNVFTIDSKAVSTPLLKLSILRLLIDREVQAAEPTETYMEVGDVERYFEPMGIGAHALTVSLREMAAYRLVEPYDPSWEEIVPEQRLAITFSGKMHMEMALQDQNYVEQMALTTAIRSEDVVRDIREVMRRKMGQDEWRQIRRRFIMHCMEQDKVFIHLPPDRMYSGQHLLRTDMEGAWAR